MSFQSFSYFAFLPVAAFLYLKVCPARFQNGLLLAASVLFYWANRPTGADWPAAWPLVPLAVLAAVCLFVWRAALALARREKGQRGRLLAAAVVALLAVLAVFKYFNFLLPVLPLAPGVLHALPFPLGISFYTFAAVSYLVDVARGDMEPEENFVNLAAFLCFFGTITAGPICRAKQVLPQLRAEHRFDASRTVRALQLFALGLFKKVAVADVIMMYVQPIYSDAAGHGGPALVAATVGYTLYLYFDFAGYSEMARASALLLGLDIQIGRAHV